MEDGKRKMQEMMTASKSAPTLPQTTPTQQQTTPPKVSQLAQQPSAANSTTLPSATHTGKFTTARNYDDALCKSNG